MHGQQNIKSSIDHLLSDQAIYIVPENLSLPAEIRICTSLTLYALAVRTYTAIKTPHFAHAMCLRVLYDAYNKQPLLPHTLFTYRTFLIEAKPVTCELRNESLHTSD
jgi:hypothetical protein